MIYKLDFLFVYQEKIDQRLNRFLCDRISLSRIDDFLLRLILTVRNSNKRKLSILERHFIHYSHHIGVFGSILESTINLSTYSLQAFLSKGVVRSFFKKFAHERKGQIDALIKLNRLHAMSCYDSLLFFEFQTIDHKVFPIMLNLINN